MSQLAASPLSLVDLVDLIEPAEPAEPADFVAETAIFEPVFERLAIRPVAPFPSPRLRLVVASHAASRPSSAAAHDEGGRRLSAAPAPRAALPAAGGARRVRGAGRRPVRLTRRGRIVCVILLALAVTAVMFAVGVVPSMASPASSGTVSGTSSDAAASVVVQPGDTLWSIAVAAAPHADPRATVQKIIDRNGLRSAEIQAGQVLALPS